MYDYIENGKPQNCWEYWKCNGETKETCYTYRAKSGRECWMFQLDMQPKCERGFSSCLDCPWFEIIKPNF